MHRRPPLSTELFSPELLSPPAPGQAAPPGWCLRQGIRASAGSGKTYSLTGQYLRAFLTGSDPAAMLATTFTRKAAGEILGRVLQRLAGACESEDLLRSLCTELQLSPMECAEARAQLLRLCRCLHQVSISTIDSFFSKLLRGYGHELGIAPSTRMVDEESPEMRRLQREAVGLLLGRPDQTELLALFSDLHAGKAKCSLAGGLAHSFEKGLHLYETAPPAAWRPCRAAAALLAGPAFAAAVDRLEAAAAGCPTAAMTKAVTTDVARLRAAQWKDSLAAGVAKSVVTAVATEAVRYGKTPVPEHLVRLYEPLVAHALGSLLEEVRRKTSALYQALGWYHEAYLQLRRQENVLLFSDVPRELAAFLPGQSALEVGHRLDSRVSHLLLDEFQDTSPEQYAIFKPFAEAIHHAPASEGLLFCVGDLKQSIYGWRGATPRIFARIGQDFASLQWLDNDSSRRSSSVVLDAVNRVFGSLTVNPALCKSHASVAAVWQSNFRAHTVAGAERPGYVELLESGAQAADTGRDGADEEDGARETFVADPHLHFVAERIRQIVADAPWASVGVLTRSNETVRKLLFALGGAGVHAGAEGGSPIADDPAVGLILSALRFADHPGHSAARFHVLNSPLAAALQLEGPAALPRAEAAAAIRRTLLHDGYAPTIAAWAGILAPHCDAGGARRLTQLMELADNFGDQAATRPGVFVDLVAGKLVEDSTPSKVRVMTIHKAKGLEFDCVVLPELHKDLFQPAPKLIYRRDPETMQIDRVALYPDQALRALVPELQQLHTEYSAELASEALCLLYVALTRARHALHLIVPRPKNALSLAAIVRAALGDAVPADAVPADAVPADAAPGDGTEGARAGGTLLYRHGDARWFAAVTAPAPVPAAPSPAPEPGQVPRRFNLASAATYPPRAAAQVSPSRLNADGARAASQLLKLDNAEGRRYGSAIHALFQHYEWSRASLPPEARLFEAVRLAVPGVDGARLEAYLAAFAAMLARPGVTDALARPPLAPDEALELWRERRFTALLQGALVNGTFDRVVVTRRAGRALRAEIIDFKTDAGGDASALATHYGPQMESYRAALCHMLELEPETVTAKLLALQTGELLTL